MGFSCKCSLKPIKKIQKPRNWQCFLEEITNHWTIGSDFGLPNSSWPVLKKKSASTRWSRWEFLQEGLDESKPFIYHEKGHSLIIIHHSVIIRISSWLEFFIYIYIYIHNIIIAIHFINSNSKWPFSEHAPFQTPMKSRVQNHYVWLGVLFLKHSGALDTCSVCV